MNSIISSMMGRMPDAFYKGEDGKLFKLLKIISEEIEELIQCYADIKIIRDIDNAYGVYLDRIGINLHLKRNGLSDEDYRLMLKLKIVAKKGADINNLIGIVSAIANTNCENIRLKAEKEVLKSGEPACLLLELKTKDPSYKFLSALNGITAAGINMKALRTTETNIYIATKLFYKFMFDYPVIGQDGEDSVVCRDDDRYSGKYFEFLTGVYQSSAISEFKYPILGEMVASDENILGKYFEFQISPKVKSVFMDIIYPVCNQITLYSDSVEGKFNQCNVIFNKIGYLNECMYPVCGVLICGGD